jgi:hypothetical protein
VHATHYALARPRSPTAALARPGSPAAVLNRYLPSHLVAAAPSLCGRCRQGARGFFLLLAVHAHPIHPGVSSVAGCSYAPLRVLQISRRTHGPHLTAARAPYSHFAADSCLHCSHKGNCTHKASPGSRAAGDAVHDTKPSSSGVRSAGVSGCRSSLVTRSSPQLGVGRTQSSCSCTDWTPWTCCCCAAALCAARFSRSAVSGVTAHSRAVIWPSYMR